MKRVLTVLMICILCIMPISMAANDLSEADRIGLEQMDEIKLDMYYDFSFVLDTLLVLTAIMLLLKFISSKINLKKLEGEEKEFESKKINKSFIKELTIVIGIAVVLKVLLLILDLFKII